MEVMVLGHRGMLGRAVHKYLINKGVNVDCVSDARYPQDNFSKMVKEYSGDFIVNCIGAIPQRTDDFSVNYKLPEFLSSTGKKIVHPDTDCIFEGDSFGGYSKRDAPDAKSEYGQSKARVLTVTGEETKVIRSCIIGFDDQQKSLMSWFLGSQERVFGFTNHYMNCITTHQWAKICLDMCLNWDSQERVVQVGTKCMSKYYLLKVVKSVFNKNIEIIPHEHKVRIHRCLKTDIELPCIRSQLEEFKEFSEYKNAVHD